MPNKNLEELPKQLHNWYLEAVKKINKTNYNNKANVSYDNLNEEQKFLDKYIANKINQNFIPKSEVKKMIEEIETIKENILDIDSRKSSSVPDNEGKISYDCFIQAEEIIKKYLN